MRTERNQSIRAYLEKQLAGLLSGFLRLLSHLLGLRVISIELLLHLLALLVAAVIALVLLQLIALADQSEEQTNNFTSSAVRHGSFARLST